MAGRPCNPGSDLHGLWRLLLPGTAFPACGVAQGSDTDGDKAPLAPEPEHRFGQAGGPILRKE